MKKKCIDFFATHPEATVVFIALGVLFTDSEKANAYCGGTTAKVETITKEQVEEWKKESVAEATTEENLKSQNAASNNEKTQATTADANVDDAAKNETSENAPESDEQPEVKTDDTKVEELKDSDSEKSATPKADKKRK